MKLVIDFEKPPGADLDDIAQFVIASLTSWGGGLHPEDPMFHSLHLLAVKVHGKSFTVPETRK